jgi:diguanylate cyclase (GGDEF)-like protein/PAS domain S-box-containing protein
MYWLTKRKTPLPPSSASDANSETFASLTELGRSLLSSGVAALAAFSLCLISGALKAMAGEIVAVWIADGYLLGHAMAVPRARKPFVLAGGALGLLAANFWVGESTYVSMSFTLAGMVEVCAAMLLAPRATSAKELTKPRAFTRFIVTACCLAPILSGIVAAALLEGIFTNHPFSSFSNWAISDALGFVIFTPVTLAVLSGEWKNVLETRSRLKSLSLLVVLGVVTVAVFAESKYPASYWVLPPLALLAFQANLATVLVGTLLFIVIAVVMTVHGDGPFWAYMFPTMQDRILALQVFTLAALMIVLPISILQAGRARLLAMLADGERRYRLLAENSDDVIVQLATNGAIQYVSPRVVSTLGYAPASLLGAFLPSLAHPDDRLRLETAISDVNATHVEQTVEYRIRRHDDSYVWVRSFISAMVAGTTEGGWACSLTIRDIHKQVVDDINRTAQEEELKRLAYVDGLTGLKNRRYFDAHMSKLSSSAAGHRGAYSIALLLIDVDHFKAYNDKYGHPAGDECLKHVAACIASAVRESDVVARYGGEEFAVVLADASLSETLEVAERIRHEVEALAIPHAVSSTGFVTLSIGVSHADRHADDDARRLLETADMALYRAKETGRNQIRMISSRVD